MLVTTGVQVTSAVGKRRNSQVLIANAWHHRTDAVSSLVALVAIGGSMCGWPMLDPVAGLMVAGMVSLTGVQVHAFPHALPFREAESRHRGMRESAFDAQHADRGWQCWEKRPSLGLASNAS